ncbi:metallophosphoesterase family protein [Paenibacillus rigui]|uniref:Phosphohydrolase n=1 Tax=Paenibacillus rigui TaxID=554312 RepID=A0A229UWI2_9BACL|nr:metallophosphoesterase [Paenibacillus rigui]OXM87778.1 phosphohydrolase [Paenibacillus rigui]
MNTWSITLALLLGFLSNPSAPAAVTEPTPAPTPAYAQPVEQLRLSFPVVSDIHIQADDKNSHNKLKAALQDLQELRPQADALIINGDLTDGKPSDYKKLTELLNTSPHPSLIWSSIGNHEFYKAWYDARGRWNPDGFPNGETESASIHRFLQFNGESSVYYDKQLNGYHFIFLGSEQYRQSDPNNNEDAYLSAEQLNWLKQTLQKDAGKPQPVFIFLHQPLPDTVAGTSNFINNRAIVQHQELKKILSEYPQAIFFTGHTHWELKSPNTLAKGAFTMVNTSSLEQPWTNDATGAGQQASPSASEGLVVDVYNNKVVIRGRDFEAKQWVPEAQFTVPAAAPQTAP